MPTMHFTLKPTATPEQARGGLTDFGPGRARLFASSKDGYLKVHSLGPTAADVTAGSAGSWERLNYDWFDPGHIILTTTDSNTWGRRSGHSCTLAPQADGTTEVDVVVVREGKNLKGRPRGALLQLGGKRVIVKAFANMLKATRRATRQRHRTLRSRLGHVARVHLPHRTSSNGWGAHADR
jgi:hypothetical protein